MEPAAYGQHVKEARCLRPSFDGGVRDLLLTTDDSMDSCDTFGTASPLIRRASTSNGLHTMDGAGMDCIAEDSSTCLACDEHLLFEDDDDEELSACSPGLPQHTDALLTTCLPSLHCVPGVVDSEVLRNELECESGCPPGPLPNFDSALRKQTLSWLFEVATELQLQGATLFLACTYFDKFLEVSKAVPPGNLLQLLGLACISIAAKHDEVMQRPSQEWLNLARGEEGLPMFTKDDLRNMEMLVLENLEWRLRLPTASSFLHLLLPSLWSSQDLPGDNLKQLVADLATLLTELSLLDDCFLSFRRSTIAGASLVLAEYVVLRNPPSLVSKALVNDLLPGTTPDALRACVTALHQLQVNELGAAGGAYMAPAVRRYRNVLRAVQLVP